ncbi:MAG: YigZ family protein [Clostridia bacterium]|nr:YigZ family protein [Clostridia bacterium]
MKEFVTIGREIVSAENVINKSRFIGYACGVDTVEDATAFIDSIRKKNYDATHNCYAYAIGALVKFSDDGEPSQTAGKPILDVILKKELTNLVVVVTRYFGGIKLGAGGLVRAYSGACASVLSKAPVLRYRDCAQVEVICDYSQYKAVQSLIGKRAEIIETVFDSAITIRFRLPTALSSSLICDITEITNGRADINQKGDILIPFDENIFNEK